MGCVSCGRKAASKAADPTPHGVAGISGSRPATPAPRPPCRACCLKHLGQALVLLDEARQPEYAVHRWIAVGHLAEAEAEIAGLSSAVAARVRRLRHDVERGDLPDLLTLMNDVSQLEDVPMTLSAAHDKTTSTGNAPGKRALLIGLEWVKGPLGQAMIEGAARHGIDLDARSASTPGATLREWLTEAPASICWGLRMPPEWYRRHGPMLCIENGLLAQRSGIWIDRLGRWEQSWMCRRREWRQSPAMEEMERLRGHVRRHLGREWQAFRTTAVDRQQVLIAMQSRSDAPVKWHSSMMGRASRDPWKALLSTLATHLPRGPRYLVRPHPRFIDDWRKDEARLLREAWREDFELDTSKDVYDRLGQCRAMVTVNSTLATEALALGTPVATLGLGCWLGSGAMLECHANPARLGNLLEWQPDAAHIERLLAAVMRHQLSYQASAEEVANHPEMVAWVERIKQDQVSGKKP